MSASRSQNRLARPEPAGPIPRIAYGVVLGAPRSGTTFLMRFMESAPRTEAVSGNLLPTVIPHLVNHDIPLLVNDALQYGFRRALDDYLESGAFNARAPAVRKAFLTRQGFLDGIRGRRVIDRIVYKEPFLAFAPQFTLLALPHGRLIYLVRDGRDVADSLVRSYGVLTDEALTRRTTEAPLLRAWRDRRVPWWVEEGREDDFLSLSAFARAAWMWSAMVTRCRDCFSQPEVETTGRVLQVRYEDLIRDPQTWGESVSSHLDMIMTRRMLAQIRSARSSSIGIHNRRGAQEIEDATRVAAGALRDHGYLG